MQATRIKQFPYDTASYAVCTYVDMLCKQFPYRTFKYYSTYARTQLLRTATPPYLTFKYVRTHAMYVSARSPARLYTCSCVRSLIIIANGDHTIVLYAYEIQQYSVAPIITVLGCSTFTFP